MRVGNRKGILGKESSGWKLDWYSSPEEAFTGYGTMSKYVRIWSNLIQISALIKANSVEMPKTMRIFVSYLTRACVAPGSRPISWIGNAGLGMFSVDAKSRRGI